MKFKILTVAVLTFLGSLTGCNSDRVSFSGLNAAPPGSLQIMARKDPAFMSFFSNTYSGDMDVPKTWEYNPDKQFIKMVNQARKSLDICIYYLDSDNITNAIIKAHKRGVQVRLVVDTDTFQKDSVHKLVKAKIPVVDDHNRTAFMHNKFAVVDRKIVWTGSFNLTDKASWLHSDNAIKITSPELAENYTAEFEEMFIDKQFGRTSPNNVKNRDVRVGEKKVRTLFAPEDNVAGEIIREIKNARKEILFMGFSFTHDEIANALVDASKRGVKISGIFENVGAHSKSSVFQKLLKADINVLTNKGQSLMHHKVFILDKKKVITGSFNFSYSASLDNDENVVIIQDTTVAKDYTLEFMNIRGKADTGN